ncbi:hypothetical protein NE237_001731 [Protea cynaroides]|uniref:CRIB domain-containing protein n=1 Tax=Protea cynaroides TaxID=273540 RepID=A0A9Q0KTV8_9MAGN|nr:hypothetical protein NE237_001731 [Protea cynaroides]
MNEEDGSILMGVGGGAAFLLLNPKEKLSKTQDLVLFFFFFFFFSLVKVSCFDFVSTITMATKIKGLCKGIKCISQIFVVKEQRELEIGYPTDVKHVAHIGWDSQSTNAPPSWMNEFKTSSDTSAASVGSIGGESDPSFVPISSWDSQDFETAPKDVPKAPKKHKRKKTKSSSSPKSSASTRGTRGLKSKSSFAAKVTEMETNSPNNQQGIIL